MGRKCSVCEHPNKDAIEAALVAGSSYRDISGQFGASRGGIARHAKNHLIPALAKARQAEEVASADQFLAQVRDLHARTLAILERAEDAGEERIALRAIREARGNLELLAKLLGELETRPQVNVLLMPEWVRVRTILLATLAPYPEARGKVAHALMEAEIVPGE